MRQQFNPENFNAWLSYYTDQASQVGYGMMGFKGTPYQRGAGLGSFFRSLFRMALPLFKSAANTVGRQALATSASMATDVLQGKPALQTLEDRGKEGLSNLMRKASDSLQTQHGRGLGVRPKSIKGSTNDIFNNQHVTN